MSTAGSGKKVKDRSNSGIVSTSTVSLDDSLSSSKGYAFTSSADILVGHESKDQEAAREQVVVANTEEIALKALHVDDDPTLNPWTFRMLFLGKSI